MALAIALTPLAAAAETVLRVGESVAVTSDQTVLDDFYAAGGVVTVSGEIQGDMYAVGGSVTVNGSVAQDLAALGGSVQVHAPVADDVRVVGGDVTIAERIEGDLFVIAGALHVLSSAEVTGNIFFYGGEAEVNGSVGGSVMGAAERFRIDAPVAGSVEVASSRPLVLGERASISGDVAYTSFGEMVRAQNAVVEGEVLRNEPEREDRGIGIGGILTAFIVHLFAVLCIFLGFKRHLMAFAAATTRNLGRNGLIGIAAMFLVPLGAALLMVTFLGMLLGLLGLFSFLALMCLAIVLIPVVVGSLIARLATNAPAVSLMWLVAGTLIVHLTLLVPYVGFLLVLMACAVTFGSLIFRLYHFLR